MTNACRRATSFHENGLFAALRLMLNNVQGTAMTVSVPHDLDRRQSCYGLELARGLSDAVPWTWERSR